MTDESHKLSLSWHDANWIPFLTPHNVLEYFCQRANPFYDRTCNNENVKMQRLNPEQLIHMTGIEYTLLHVDEPSELMIIRKQERQSPAHAMALANYYILRGVIYQAPDLHHVLNSRLTTSLHHLQQALDTTLDMSRYHPNKGHWWTFDNKSEQDKADETKQPCSMFQKERVDGLLDILTSKYKHYVLKSGVVENKVKDETPK